ITADELEQRLNQSICHYGSPLYFFKPHTSDNVNAMPGLMYSLDYGRRLASWNTTLNIKLECECSLVTAKAFGFFGPYISAGDLDVELAGREVVSFEALNRTGSVFLKKTEVKAASSDNTEGSWNHWCSKRIAFSAALTKLSTLLATTL
uniref:Oxysterol-binding protein n=2 Tax=Mesocestoides corti TaxID=53468 RepID=A0A5K3G2H6_MESCO